MTSPFISLQFQLYLVLLMLIGPVALMIDVVQVDFVCFLALVWFLGVLQSRKLFLDLVSNLSIGECLMLLLS